MEIALREATLVQLDGLQADALALFLDERERPLQGVAGLVDWRLCGQLSRVLATGFFQGAGGEALLMPIGQRLKVARLLVFGVGAARDGAAALQRAFEAAPKAGVKSLALSLDSLAASIEEQVALWRQALRGARFDRQVLIGDQRTLGKPVRAALAGDPAFRLEGEPDAAHSRRA